MAYPLASAAFVVLLAAIALLFSGISSIIAGLRGGKSEEKNSGHTASTRSRALAIILSIAIMVSPLFGIALLVYGIRLVVTGISGRGETVTCVSS